MCKEHGRGCLRAHLLVPHTVLCLWLVLECNIHLGLLERLGTHNQPSLLPAALGRGSAWLAACTVELLQLQRRDLSPELAGAPKDTCRVLCSAGTGVMEKRAHGNRLGRKTLQSQKSHLNDEQQVQCKNLFSVENNSSRASYVLSSASVRALTGSRIPVRWLSQRDSSEGTTYNVCARSRGPAGVLRFPEAKELPEAVTP